MLSSLFALLSSILLHASVLSFFFLTCFLHCFFFFNLKDYKRDVSTFLISMCSRSYILALRGLLVLSLPIYANIFPIHQFSSSSKVTGEMIFFLWDLRKFFKQFQRRRRTFNDAYTEMLQINFCFSLQHLLCGFWPSRKALPILNPAKFTVDYTGRTIQTTLYFNQQNIHYEQKCVFISFPIPISSMSPAEHGLVSSLTHRILTSELCADYGW